jgi:GNAT superfamily N-acetyltransferase
VAKQNDRLVGCAILKNREISVFEKVRVNFPKMLFYFIPFLMSMKFKNAKTISGLLKLKIKLEKPYFKFEVIGVHNEFQGMGIGKLLLNRIDEILKQQKDLKGIYLFTADKRNKEIYEHNGYQVIETNKADGISVYHMFKKRV